MLTDDTVSVVEAGVVVGVSMMILLNLNMRGLAGMKDDDVVLGGSFDHIGVTSEVELQTCMNDVQLTTSAAYKSRN